MRTNYRESIRIHAQTRVLVIRSALITRRWHGTGRALSIHRDPLSIEHDKGSSRARFDSSSRSCLARVFVRARTSSRANSSDPLQITRRASDPTFGPPRGRLIFKIRARARCKTAVWAGLTFSRRCDRLCEGSLGAWAIFNNLSSEQSPPVDPR